MLLAVGLLWMPNAKTTHNHHADHLRKQFDMVNKRLASIAPRATALAPPVHWQALGSRSFTAHTSRNPRIQQYEQSSPEGRVRCQVSAISAPFR